MTQANKGNTFHGVSQDSNLNGASSSQSIMCWVWPRSVGLLAGVVPDSVLDGQSKAIREIHEEPMPSWGEFNSLHGVFAVGIGIGAGLSVERHKHIIAKR